MSITSDGSEDENYADLKNELYVLGYIYVQSYLYNGDLKWYASDKKIESYLRTISSPTLNNYVHTNSFDVGKVVRKLRDDGYISGNSPYYLSLKGEIALEEGLTGILGGDLRSRGYADVDQGKHSHARGLMQAMRYLQSFSYSHFYVIPNFQVLKPRNIVLSGKSQDSTEAIRIEPDALIYVDEYCPSPPQFNLARYVPIEFQQTHFEALRFKERKYVRYSVYSHRRFSPLYVVRSLELEEKLRECLLFPEGKERKDAIDRYSDEQEGFMFDVIPPVESEVPEVRDGIFLNFLYLSDDENFVNWAVSPKSVPYLDEDQLRTFDEMIRPYHMLRGSSHEKD